MYRFEEAFEEAVKDSQEIKATEALNESIKAAQKCLTNGDFHKYKAEFEKAYDLILQDMCTYTDSYLRHVNGNTDCYAMKMVQYIQRIQDLKVLLSKVQIDANKEIRNEKE